MVNAQFNLLDHFNIDKLFCVTGGSMGGMQVLQFIANYPDKSKIAIPIACSASHSAQNIAFNELGRQAIMADENWKNGNKVKTAFSKTVNKPQRKTKISTESSSAQDMFKDLFGEA